MADNFLYAQLQPFSLAGAGAVVGDTSLILKSFKDIDGVLLTMADFGSIGFGTISPGNGTLEEQISFAGITQNANGTATLTTVKSVMFKAPYTQSTGLSKTHAGSTPFVISNTAGFYDKLASKTDDETIAGIWTFTQSPIIPTGGSGTQAANNDDIANAITGFTGKATNLVAGTTKLSVAAVSGANPIAVGNNDTRVPTVDTSTVTAGMVAALAGTSGTPDAINLYITNLDSTVALVASTIVRRLPSTGDIAVPTTPGASGDATSKSYVDGQTYLTAKVGSTTRGLNDASSTQNIAHGLGRIPHIVRIKAQVNGLTTTNLQNGVPPYQSDGMYDGTTTVCMYSNFGGTNGQANDTSITTSYMVSMTFVGTGSGSTSQVATVTVDTTNIILVWTKGGTGNESRTISIAWQVE